MAEKKTAKKKASAEEKGVLVKLTWDSPEDLETIYANHLFISHSGPEFYLIFGELLQPIIFGTGDVPGEMRIVPKVKIAISPTQMKEMADAISGNVNKYIDKEKRNDSK